jgi:S1-C subfamily serine protease
MLVRAFAAASTLFVSSATALPPPQIPYKAIVIVSCGDRLGTAFHIGSGRWITASHVVGPASSCTIGDNRATVTGDNVELDIAELSGPLIDEKIEIDCSGFKVGQEYLAIGYAGGQYRTSIPLIYSGFGRDPDTGNGEFIGADSIPGMSGGPILNTNLQVSGITLQRWPSRGRPLGDTYLCPKAKVA